MIGLVASPVSAPPKQVAPPVRYSSTRAPIQSVKMAALVYLDNLATRTHASAEMATRANDANLKVRSHSINVLYRFGIQANVHRSASLCPLLASSLKFNSTTYCSSKIDITTWPAMCGHCTHWWINNWIQRAYRCLVNCKVENVA